MTNLKKLIGNKSLNTKQCPAGLSPRTIPLNLYGKAWGWAKIPTNSQKFTNFSLQKNPFHLITQYKLDLQLQSLLLDHFFLILALYACTSHSNSNSNSFISIIPTFQCYLENSASLNACFPLFHTLFFILHLIKFQLTPLQLGLCGLFANQI